MKVGVELRLDRDAGELFADARALEGAGVDSFWAAPDADETALLAAIAAVTWRARVVVVSRPDAAARGTLETLSRGRAVFADDRGAERIVASGDAEDERWVRIDFPAGRAAWREVRAAREAEGIAGLVLPNDPRLLDLLRNPDVEDDRADLGLAFG